MATLCNSLTQLRAEVDAAYPARDTSSDGWLADANHPSTSDHQPDASGVVHAIDIDENLSPELGSLNNLCEYLRTKQDPRMYYLIYEGRILRSYPKPELGLEAWEWGPYTGTNTHSIHAHISANRDLAGDGSGWGITKAVLSGEVEAGVGLTDADKKWMQTMVAQVAELQAQKTFKALTDYLAYSFDAHLKNIQKTQLTKEQVAVVVAEQLAQLPTPSSLSAAEVEAVVRGIFADAGQA